MEQEINPSASLRTGRNIPRDLFLHLLAIVTLYWSANKFCDFNLAIYNNYLPDALKLLFGEIISLSLIRFNVSCFNYSFSCVYSCFLVF